MVNGRFSRRVVGWALAEHMRVGLVDDGLTRPLGRRQPPPGLVHQTDRASQYACHAYRALLTKHGMVASMSADGDCWNNAPIERFFGSLKGERTGHVRYPPDKPPRPM